ncbi:MAG: S-layer homology domain-containing protein [Clostridiales bacterium]|nr:S-layer homology domain-containing protein [Clostridiales bacterium]
MGFFGGVTEGRRLPKTMEALLTGDARNEDDLNLARVLLYKEIIFLTGKPIEFTGLIEVGGTNGVTPNTTSGQYSLQLTVYPSTSSGDIAINRTAVFNIRYRVEGNQLIKDYTLQDWNERITIADLEYTLDTEQSAFDISIIEHNAPSITYYRGDVSSRAVFMSNTNEMLIQDSADSFYGYNCAWSAIETHRMDSTITANNWQTQFQIRPSVSINKALQYKDNEPDVIGFEGNYKEVLHRDAGLKYDILQVPLIYPDQPRTGETSFNLRNTFEQLIAPDLVYLRGHPAFEDIAKLFSMQILDGDPKLYQPDQAITRAQFITALTKAIKLPVQTVASETRGRRAQTPPIIFPDVLPSRPDYPYIMSAYRNGVAFGRDFGTFYADAPLQRQEAFTVLVRSLGLTNLGLPDSRIFTDDEKIAWWARTDLAAGVRLGLIKPDGEGQIKPGEYLSKAEAASLLRNFVDYLRFGIKTDYAEHLVNYVT